MLIVQGVNVYLYAVTSIVSALQPRSGSAGLVVELPVRIRTEQEEEQDPDALLAELEQYIRQKPVFRGPAKLFSKGALAL